MFVKNTPLRVLYFRKPLSFVFILYKLDWIQHCSEGRHHTERDAGSRTRQVCRGLNWDQWQSSERVLPGEGEYRVCCIRCRFDTGYAFHCTRPTGQRPNDIFRLNRANRGEFVLLFSFPFPNPPHKWNILKISSPTNRSVKMHWEFSSGLTDPTGQSGPPQAVVTNIPFRKNWKGYFHFNFDPTVRNVWYNGKQAGCFLRKTGNNLTELLVT